MRYLKNTKTNEVVEVDDNDDTRFYKLVGERHEDGTAKYVQTGAHDPAVTSVTLPGQTPATLAEQESGIQKPLQAAKETADAPATGDDEKPAAKKAAAKPAAEKTPAK